MKRKEVCVGFEVFLKGGGRMMGIQQQSVVFFTCSLKNILVNVFSLFSLRCDVIRKAKQCTVWGIIMHYSERPQFQLFLPHPYLFIYLQQT